MALISVDVFRMRNTYDVLIANHRVIEADGARGRIQSKVIFRGRQGYLPLELTGAEKDMAGQILPEFFNKAGERMEIPPALVAAVKAGVRGANCVGCTHQHYVTTPKLLVTSPIVLPDWKHSLANGSGSTGTESPGASSEEVG
jgi:hypothetical protein